MSMTDATDGLRPPPEFRLRLDEEGWEPSARTLGELFTELAGVLQRMIEEDHVFAVLSRCGRGNRYVQVMVCEGQVRLESVSDHWLMGHPLRGRWPLEEHQIEALLRDRWEPGEESNWSRTFGRWERGVAEMASHLLVTALVDVHGLLDPSELEVYIEESVC
jgi:hypothetical protein